MIDPEDQHLIPRPDLKAVILLNAVSLANALDHLNKVDQYIFGFPLIALREDLRRYVEVAQRQAAVLK